MRSFFLLIFFFLAFAILKSTERNNKEVLDSLLLSIINDYSNDNQRIRIHPQTFSEVFSPTLIKKNKKIVEAEIFDLQISIDSLTIELIDFNKNSYQRDISLQADLTFIENGSIRKKSENFTYHDTLYKDKYNEISENLPEIGRAHV